MDIKGIIVLLRQTGLYKRCNLIESLILDTRYFDHVPTTLCLGIRFQHYENTPMQCTEIVFEVVKI